MTLTLILDLGNYGSKIGYLDEEGTVNLLSFSSVLHPYKEMENMPDVTRVTFNSYDYYIGKGVKNFYLGKEDRMYFGNIRKGHREGQIRLLYALYLASQKTKETKFNLVITSPYKSIPTDKKYFDDIFKGTNTGHINGKAFTFEIENIIVAAEGLGALAFTEKKNCIILDAGSMTVNVLQVYGGSISKEESTTLNGGTIQNSPDQLANEFIKSYPQINLDYPIVTTGGKSKEMKMALENFGYTNIEVAEPDGYEIYYANCLGLLLKYGKMFEELFN